LFSSFFLLLCCSFFTSAQRVVMATTILWSVSLLADPRRTPSRPQKWWTD
jgi:hypothetical protein